MFGFICTMHGPCTKQRHKKYSNEATTHTKTFKKKSVKKC